jgi:hypothetical protein
VYLLFRADHVGGAADGVVDERVEVGHHGDDGVAQTFSLFLGSLADVRKFF